MQSLKILSVFAVLALVRCGGTASPSAPESPATDGVDEDSDGLEDEVDCPKLEEADRDPEKGLTIKHEGPCSCEAGVPKLVIRHRVGNEKGADAGRVCFKLRMAIKVPDGGNGCTCPPGTGSGGIVISKPM